MGLTKPIEQYLFSNLLIRIHVFMYLKDIIRGVNAMCGLGASIRDEGRAEEKENMVLEMLKKNLSLELISDISKLSLEEIKQIQEKSLIAN